MQQKWSVFIKRQRKNKFENTIGHDSKLGHTRLSEEDKQLIAIKRKMGIGKDRILKHIKEDIGMCIGSFNIPEIAYEIQ